MTDINVSFDQPQIVVQFPDTPTQTIYWGSILGVLADQTDLVTALSLRMLKSANLSDVADVATARSNLGLVIGTDVQAQNANLSAIAGLTSATDKVAYFTGAGTAALADFTSFGRSIVAAVNSAAVGALLGLVIGSTVQAYDANTTILGNTTTGTGAIVRDISPTLTTPNIGAAVATSITASGSGGFLIESNSGTDVALFGAGGGSNATFYGGVSLSTFTQGSIVFAGSGGLLSQDNSSFYFDDTNNRVGLLTTAPTHTLTLGSTGTGIAIYNTADQTTNFERFRAYWSGNTLIIGTGSGGTGTTRAMRLSVSNAGSESINLALDITRASSPAFRFRASNSPTQLVNGSQVQIDMDTTIASGIATGLQVTGTINQSSTAGWTILDLNPTIAASGSGALNFILCRKASGTTLFGVDSNGVIYFDRTYTAGGTTATQTINKPSGSVNAAAGATSVTVNNSLVTTSSLVYPVLLTNDTTAEIKNVVVSAGSFVINFVAAVTAETKIGRFVVNT